MVLVALMAGCSFSDGNDDPVLECAIVEVGANKVFGGTQNPTIVPLETGQIVSIGSLDICSGTLIADKWVLTAKHCPLTLDIPFCIGLNHDTPDACIEVARLIEHPTADFILAELAEEPRVYHPGVAPIPIMTEMLDCSWLGTMAEAAGYGKTELGDRGTRLFLGEPIVALTDEYVLVDGLGRTGLCRGDSGGPVMVTDSDGAVRVAGALSFGDISCRGQDAFSRTDRAQEWILDHIGEAPISTPKKVH